MRLYFLLVFLLPFPPPFLDGEFKLFSGISEEKDHVIILTSDSIFRINKSKLDITTGKAMDSPIINIKRFTPFSLKNTLYLVGNGDGEVHKIKGAIDERVDRSNMKDVHINAAIFKHKDTIFKFGGHGYWDANNKLIFWDLTTKEWELYPINPESELPPRSFSHTYFYSNSKLILFNGLTLNPISPLISEKIRTPYTFDFKTKMWQPNNTSFDLEGTPILSGPASMLLGNDHVTVFDWEKNVFKVYQSNLIGDVDIKSGIALDEEYIYFVSKSKKYMGVQKILTTDFLGILLRKSPIYDDSPFKSNVFFLFIFFIVLGISFFIILRIRKKRFIILKSDHLSYKRRIYRVPDNTQKILSYIAQNPSFKTSDLYDFLYNPNLHPNHIYKIINYELLKIADLLKFITQSDKSVFIKSKYEEDRRISIITFQIKSFPLKNKS